MTNGMRRSGRIGARFPRRAALTIASIVGLAVLFVVPAAAMAGVPATTWGATPPSWTNGRVLCVFSPSVPSVGVSALARPGTGLTVGLGSLVEVTADGSIVATANVSGATWTAENLSSEDAYDLSYTASASVVGPAAASEGTVSLQVQFVLPAYETEPTPSLDAVQVALSVLGWPWQAAADHLTLSLVVTPSFPSAEHLVLGAATGPLVAGTSRSSGATWEELYVSSSANATPLSGGTIPVRATASVAGTSSAATVGVAFGTAAGAFTSLSYTAQVQVVFPSTIAGIPTLDLVAVGGAAAVLSLVLAAGVRRMRRRPSDLVYAEEEP